ncbi:MAG: T9SS type A sorting domain-containing protein [Bacteroidota bacterium]|nr:T9SS type A sorting domain-containing protein [Bacteroidota bacterium]
MKKNTYFKAIGILSTMGILATNAIHGQTTVFQQIYQTTFDQSARDVISTNDGGYILAGMTENYILGDTNLHFIKTNNLGDTTWTATYGGGLPDYPNSILQDSDGNYMVAAYTKSFGAGGTDSYILKLNGSGDTIWTKTFGGSGEDEAKEIIASGDGNFIVVGRTNSISGTSQDMYLMKIDPSGNMIWTKTYGGPQFESGNSVKICLDGGYILGGQTLSYGSGMGDHWLLRTNSSGDSLWSKTFGGTAFDETKYVLANPDGTFTLCGNSYISGDADIQAIKTDASGNVIWDKMYGGTDKDVSKTIEPTSDGGYILSSISRSFGWINPDMWLLKINGSGDTVWTKNYGSFDHEHAYCAKQTADDGFIAVGHSKSYGPNMKIMFIKLNQYGTFTVSVDQLFAEELIDVFPNPTDGLLRLNIKGNNRPFSFNIVNPLGQIVYYKNSQQDLNSEESTIDLTGNKPGMYFMNLISGERSTTKKLILR